MVRVFVSKPTMQDYMKMHRLWKVFMWIGISKLSTRDLSPSKVKEECSSYVNKNEYICDEAYFRRYLLDLLGKF